MDNFVSGANVPKDYTMNRRFFIATLTAASFSACFAMAATFQDSIVTELRTAGYKQISVESTWLGRIRIRANKGSEVREIVLNPRTGEVLRDVARVSDTASSGSAGGKSSSSTGSSGSSTSGSSSSGSGSSGSTSSGSSGSGSGGSGTSGSGSGTSGSGTSGSGGSGSSSNDDHESEVEKPEKPEKKEVEKADSPEKDDG